MPAKISVAASLKIGQLKDLHGRGMNMISDKYEMPGDIAELDVRIVETKLQ